MQLRVYISDKLITPFKEGEETTYKLGWSGTLARLGIDAATEKTEDRKILETVFDVFNYGARPDGYPENFRTFSVGALITNRNLFSARLNTFTRPFSRRKN